MSNLIGKFASQLSGQSSSLPSSSQQQSSSRDLIHKLSDAVTGQKHPQDDKNQQMPGDPSRSSRYPQQHLMEGSTGHGSSGGYGASYPPSGPPQGDGLRMDHGVQGGYNSEYNAYKGGRPEEYGGRGGGFGSGHAAPGNYNQHGGYGAYDKHGGSRGGHGGQNYDQHGGSGGGHGGYEGGHGGQNHSQQGGRESEFYRDGGGHDGH